MAQKKPTRIRRRRHGKARKGGEAAKPPAANALPPKPGNPHLAEALEQAFEHHRHGRLNQALAIYHQILEQDPDHPDALHRAGVVAFQLGDSVTAIVLLRRAISIYHHDPTYYFNLGTVLTSLGKLDEAIYCYHEAVRLAPNNATYHANLGGTLAQGKRLDEAVHHYEEALRLSPKEQRALGGIVNLAMRRCDWGCMDQHLPGLLEQTRRLLAQGQKSPLDPLYSLALPIELPLIKEAVEIFTHNVVFAKQTLSHAPKSHSNRLRVGYISPDFSQHAVGYLFADMMSLHNHDEFDIFGYSLREASDSYRKQIEQSCDHFLDISSMSDNEAAILINRDNIDILVDLAGYTTQARPRIAGFQPAPIQAHYLGYPGTLAAKHIQYHITTTSIVSPELEDHYVESLVFLPETVVARYLPEIPDISLSREDLGLPEQAIVFCCFNGSYRIDAAVFSSCDLIPKKMELARSTAARATPPRS